MKRKILAFLLFLVILLECSGSFAVTGGEEKASSTANYSLVERIINAYSVHEETIYAIKRSVLLKSFATNAYDYTLYELEPYGYAILFDETMDLMEACYEPGSASPFGEEDGKVVFYAGPGNYYALDGALIKNTMNGEALDYETMLCLAAVDAEAQSCSRESLVVLSDPRTSSPQTSIVPSDGLVKVYAGKSYFENLNKGKYGKNENGTCTVIAVQMLLGYYDNYICDQYVAAAYESGSGTSEAFHQLLNGYVYGDQPQGGIFIHDAAVGINTYLSSRKITARLNSVYSTADAARERVFSLIKSGQPAAASMSRSLGGEANHSVLVYGIQYNPELMVAASQTKFIVHMGWDDAYNAYVTAGAWYYECGYLSHNTHSYGVWTQNGTATHKRVCPCGATETESHSKYWNSSTKKCSRCGYVGNISTVTSVQYTQ